MKTLFTIYTARQLKEPHTLHCHAHLDCEAVVEVRRSFNGGYAFTRTMLDMGKRIELTTADELAARIRHAEELGTTYDPDAHGVVLTEWTEAARQCAAACDATITHFQHAALGVFDLPITY